MKTHTHQVEIIIFSLIMSVSDLPCTKKGLKFAPVVELAKLNFTYITDHSTKIAKAGPEFIEIP